MKYKLTLFFIFVIAALLIINYFLLKSGIDNTYDNIKDEVLITSTSGIINENSRNGNKVLPPVLCKTSKKLYAEKGALLIFIYTGVIYEYKFKDSMVLTISEILREIKFQNLSKLNAVNIILYIISGIISAFILVLITAVNKRHVIYAIIYYPFISLILFLSVNYFIINNFLPVIFYSILNLILIIIYILLLLQKSLTGNEEKYLLYYSDKIVLSFIAKIKNIFKTASSSKL